MGNGVGEAGEQGKCRLVSGSLMVMGQWGTLFTETRNLRGVEICEI